MKRISITHELPVSNPCLAHLILECGHLIRRGKRVFCTGTYQHTRLHFVDFSRRLCRENTVYADDGPEIGAIARKFECNRTTETKSHGRELGFGPLAATRLA